MSEEKKDKEAAAHNRLKNAILEGKKVNLIDETFALDGVDDLLKDLDEDQKIQVRKGVIPMITPLQSMIDMLTETMQDPEKKNQFLEEARKRFGGK